MEKELNEKKEIIIESLVEFIERATKENATVAEINALPDVAKAVLEFQYPYSLTKKE